LLSTNATVLDTPTVPPPTVLLGPGVDALVGHQAVMQERRYIVTGYASADTVILTGGNCAEYGAVNTNTAGYLEEVAADCGCESNSVMGAPGITAFRMYAVGDHITVTPIK
jgi:hypothetical protein